VLQTEATLSYDEAVRRYFDSPALAEGRALKQQPNRGLSMQRGRDGAWVLRNVNGDLAVVSDRGGVEDPAPTHQ
jgi:hypothetical protein